MTRVVRTPEERFNDLPDYPFDPNYVVIDDPDYGELRMHYVEAGPADGPPVLLLHGQPTWSFLYRKVIPVLAERGYRAIAPDYIGFGRSDKIDDRFAYTLKSHIGWVTSLIRQLDLQGITGVFQDWGGPIGFGILVGEGDRFARVVASDTACHTCDAELKDRLELGRLGNRRPAGRPRGGLRRLDVPHPAPTGLPARCHRRLAGRGRPLGGGGERL